MKFRFILLLNLIVLFNNCTSKENHQDILGVWDLYSVTHDEKIEVIDYKSHEEMDGCFKKHSIRFDENTFKNTIISFHGCEEEYAMKGTYIIKNKELINTYKSRSVFSSPFSPLEKEETIRYSFSISNDQLTLVNGKEIRVYKKHTGLNK